MHRIMHLSSFSLILLSYWLLATNCFNFKLPASSKYRFFQSTLSPSSKRLSISNNQPLRSSKGSIIAPDVGNRTDYRSDADYIRDSIVCWLNTEFIDLECHYKIGDRVRDAYLRLRESGITDAGEMMLEIGTSLEVGKVDFDKAFVGPWDVANRASDIIFELLDVEACACSAPRSGNTPDSSIVQITSDCRVTRAEILPQKMQSLTSDFHSSMFIRYNFLKRFLEGVPNGSYMQFTDEGSGWTEASIAVALVLGFRPNVSGQDQALAPVGWSGLTAVPDFSPGLLSPVLVVKQAGDDDSKLFSDCVDRRLNADLPEDEKASDTVLEQLAGFEMYQAMKRRQDTCAESRRRVLLVKWLYILGFLSQDFPPVTRFTPPHLRDDDADFE